MGLLDPVLCCEAVPELWTRQQRHDGVGVAHGDLHLQVLLVSSQTSCCGKEDVCCFLPGRMRAESAGPEDR